MGSTTSSDLGNFQESAGQISSQIGVISAYFGAFLMISFAIIFAVIAFIPSRDEQACQDNTDCEDDDKCIDNVCVGKIKPPKKKHYGLLGISFFLIILAIFVIYYALTLRKIAYGSRAGAQVVGLMGEADLARSVIH